MVRRTSKAKLRAVPWWLYFGLALLAFILLRHLVPNMHTNNIMLSLLAALAPVVALPITGLLILAGVVSWAASFSKRKSRSLLISQSRGIAMIRSLGWLEFEYLAGEMFKRQGYSVLENESAGADDGVDLEIKRDSQLTLVQVKHWKKNSVGVSTVREHLGVMTSRNVTNGIIVCSGKYTNPAIAFAEQNNIELIDGERLAKLVESVQYESTLLPVSPPYECPKCGNNMVERVAKNGKHAGSPFLGCSRFPQCRGMLSL